MNLKQAEHILHEHFGYQQFRGQQSEIIEHILAKNDALVIMPTGGGKSLCFQIPALLFEGITLVISPLISLMKDQVESLQSNGIQAAYLNSSVNETDRYSIFNDIHSGKLKILYCSPEILVSGLSTWIRTLQLSFVAVDEAHCVSMWGHDFRPEYRAIHELKSLFPENPIAAFTASADGATQKDICKQLGIPNAKTYISSFDRPNLFLDVRGNLPKKEKTHEIVGFIRERPNESGIIYCLSRKETEAWADILRSHGIAADFYHAGMETEDRNQVQQDFIRDDVQVICATVAFGMGIDKSNVRWIIHTNLPKNMEGYYQEIGRAGRDGLTANTKLYFSYRDVVLQADFAEQSSQKEVLLEKLQRMLHYAETSHCKRKILLSYFGEQYEKPCGTCSSCLTPSKKIDGTILAQQALSAIKRAKEKISQNTLIDILRGMRNKNILDNHFHELKTFGVGKNHSFLAWRHYITEFKNLGLIDIDWENHLNLKVSSYGNEVLFGNQTLEIVEYQEKDKPKSKEPKKDKALAPTQLRSDEILFDRLKMLRRKLAIERNVPPYIIFNDATLQEMAQQLPTNEGEMLAINGVGNQKWLDFGSSFIELIQQHIRENNSKLEPYQVTQRWLEQGKTVSEISKVTGLQEITLYSHIAKLILEDYPIEINDFIPIHIWNQLDQAGIEPNDENAINIYEHFDRKIPFGMVRVFGAWKQKSKEIIS